MNNRFHYRYMIPVLIIGCVWLIIGCSTQKNTSQTRWWHSFTAKYNTYYNGALAYIDGSLEKENGNKDNFTEIIPLYTVGNKNSRDLGKGNYDRAIEKAKKAIHQHSIKKRPEWKKNRKKTAKDLEWLSRREYNPFLWKAWMLMGRSQFYKGDFDEAAATFSYMSRLYQTQPAIYGKARAWLAKCYVEQDWLYDAEDVIRNMQRDSMDWRAVKEWDYTYADYYIHTGDFEKAIPYLKKVIKHEMRRKQKAREWYLMGQLQAALGNKDEAYKAFKHVIRQNPPYELEFNARIAMTEVMAAGKSKQMISRLKRMAVSDKNKDYLDQVYYAIGNIYLSDKDTVNAITAYEKGNEKATRSGIEKGVLLLHLGDLYWLQEKFSDAKRCYGEAIGLLDKERDDYKQLSERSVVLDELVPYTEAVHLQDSLQELAKMSEEDRNKAIDRVIDALKKKEKEERKKQAEADAASQQAQNGGSDMTNVAQSNVNTKQGTGAWYFYNPMAVAQGKTTFQQQWGKRENVDDWQRSNKTVVGNLMDEDQSELTDEQRDSLMRAEQVADSLEHVTDSAQNDPHKREYYLAQIPFTPEQLEASNKILEDGLHHAGVIFKDKLDHLPLSEKFLRRVSDDYPDYEEMADVYYHLFLLYSRMGMPVMADSYVEKLKEQYPDHQWTTVLTDPYFTENAKFGVHIEDSLYAVTYDAFKNNRYNEVRTNAEISEQRFPLGANRDKFLFIGGLSKLNDGDAEGCVANMKEVVEKFPSSRISEMAGMIVNGVNAGKRLRGGRFDLGDVWDRRTSVMNDSDSIKVQQFSKERIADYLYMVVYDPDSVSENKLLFEMAKFNFTSFLVRNFDIEIQEDGGLCRMIISGFRSFDEAYQYARQVHEQSSIVPLLQKAKSMVISVENMAMIGAQFSYNDYDEFYKKNFAPLKVTTRYLLSEPAEVATPRERDLEEEIQSKAPTQDDVNAMDGQTIPTEDDVVIPTEEDTPVAPVEDIPNTPETPVSPETPAIPETPVIPETPAIPETPNVPEIPVSPESPTPVSPETPEIPVTPEPPAPSVIRQAPEIPEEDNIIIPADDQPVIPTTPVTPSEDDIIIMEDAPAAEDDSIIILEETPSQPTQQEENFIFDEDEEKAGNTDEYIDFNGF